MPIFYASSVCPFVHLFVLFKIYVKMFKHINFSRSSHPIVPACSDPTRETIITSNEQSLREAPNAAGAFARLSPIIAVQSVVSQTIQDTDEKLKQYYKTLIESNTSNDASH